MYNTNTVDNVTQKKTTYAAVFLRSHRVTNALQDDTLPSANEESATGECNVSLLYVAQLKSVVKKHIVRL